MTIFDVHQKLSPSGVSFVCLIDWESERAKERESEKEVSGCWIKFLLARSLTRIWRFFLYCYYDDDDDNDDRRWMR